LILSKALPAFGLISLLGLTPGGGRGVGSGGGGGILFGGGTGELLPLFILSSSGGPLFPLLDIKALSILT
jgi:hypothetical protein